MIVRILPILLNIQDKMKDLFFPPGFCAADKGLGKLLIKIRMGVTAEGIVSDESIFPGIDPCSPGKLDCVPCIPFRIQPGVMEFMAGDIQR